MIRRSLILAVVATLVSTSLVLAGVSGAHFVGSPSISTSGNSATVGGKVAGLGNVEQITVTVVAEASCINRGNKNPSAANKDDVSATGDFPVQNGKALFSLALLADFQPDCSPPMTVSWTLISVTVTAPGVTLQFP